MRGCQVELRVWGFVRIHFKKQLQFYLLSINIVNADIMLPLRLATVMFTTNLIGIWAVIAEEKIVSDVVQSDTHCLPESGSRTEVWKLSRLRGLVGPL